MRKIFITIFCILMLCFVFSSCNVQNNNINTNEDTNKNTESIVNTDNTNTDSNVNTGDTNSDTNENINLGENPEGGDTGNDNTIDTSIKVEYDAEREASDNEFPFDNIIVERNGYDIVAAGKYYGDDFDNVKYYGSYYRIIDNYNDFSELTAWGNKIDESVFEDNFVLTLYTYKNYDVYYSHPDFIELNERGEFTNFNAQTNIGVSISEEWVIGGSTPDVDGYIPLDYEDYRVALPTETNEIIYLIISKNELPRNLPINGKINFKSIIEELE